MLSFIIIDIFLKEKVNIRIFFIINRLKKKNYKSFIRNIEERIKCRKSKLSLEEIMSHFFVIDSTNK